MACINKPTGQFIAFMNRSNISHDFTQVALNMQSGKTLLELLIALSIFAILFTGVIPSAQSLYIQHRITAELNLMSSYIQLARINAIEQHTSVTLCPSPDYKSCDTSDWSLPKMLFFDGNANNERDNDEPIYYAGEWLSRSLMMKGPDRTIRFFEDGAVASTATVIVCYQDNAPRYSKAVIVSLQGRVRLSRDLNLDGMHQKGNGDNLYC
jgi:prepilin-type N-terminal cleavage/methylation domain-containing protein